MTFALGLIVGLVCGVMLAILGLIVLAAWLCAGDDLPGTPVIPGVYKTTIKEIDADADQGVLSISYTVALAERN
jgi:hypothetical protein